MNTFNEAATQLMFNNAKDCKDNPSALPKTHNFKYCGIAPTTTALMKINITHIDPTPISSDEIGFMKHCEFGDWNIVSWFTSYFVIFPPAVEFNAVTTFFDMSICENGSVKSIENSMCVDPGSFFVRYALVNSCKCFCPSCGRLCTYNEPISRSLLSTRPINTGNQNTKEHTTLL